MILDFPTIVLISVNFIEMVSILFMLLPLVDIVVLSKNIKVLKDTVQNNTLVSSSMIVGAYMVIKYGIIDPTKTLHELKALNLSKAIVSAEEKLERIVAGTDACRSYILGVFSLFFLLVLLRLFDFITFSAKLTEFCNLMADYDLVDITYTQTESEVLEQEEPTYTLADYLDEDEQVHWPSIIDFSKKEHNTIRNFFINTPKPKLKLNKAENKDLNEEELIEEKLLILERESSKRENSEPKERDKENKDLDTKKAPNPSQND